LGGPTRLQPRGRQFARSQCAVRSSARPRRPSVGSPREVGSIGSSLTVLVSQSLRGGSSVAMTASLRRACIATRPERRVASRVVVLVRVIGVRASTGLGFARLPLHVHDAVEEGGDMPTGPVRFSDDNGYGSQIAGRWGQGLLASTTARSTAMRYRSLAEGARVKYEVERGPKGPQARSIRVVASVGTCGRERTVPLSRETGGGRGTEGATPTVATRDLARTEGAASSPTPGS
jgi:hypothetical protein